MTRPSKILIFEDLPAHLDLMAQELASIDARPEIWWAPSLDSRPIQWTGPVLLTSTSFERDQAWERCLKESLHSYSLLIVDIKLPGTVCSCDDCQSDCQGLHLVRTIAQDANRERLLAKTFVATDQMPFVEGKAAQKELLDGCLQDGLSLFRKDKGFKLLADKAQAWLRFEEMGYSASHKVRDDLYLVGLQGREQRPEHVLIVGSSGTGKEQAAKFIHEFGGGGAFKVVLCGSLLEASFARSELFGHVRGAYTGALGHRAGILLTALGWAPPEKRAKVPKTAILESLKKLRDWSGRAQHLLDASVRAEQRDSAVKIEPGLASIAQEIATDITTFTAHELNSIVDQLKQWAEDAKDVKPEASEEYCRWLLRGTGEVLEVTDEPLVLRVKASAPTALIFLDEFQDLPVDVQALIMRLLEQGEMEVLGFNGKIKLVDAEGRLHLRVVGASNSQRVRQIVSARQLGSAGKSGKSIGDLLREDLVYRLAEWVVELPDLGKDEVDAFVERMQPDVEWHPNAKKLLRDRVESRSLPGHRRQLTHVIRRALAIAKYEREAGRQLGDGALRVLDSHVKTALEPILLKAETESLASVETEDGKAQHVATPVDVAKRLALKLPSAVCLASEFYVALRNALAEDWEVLGIPHLQIHHSPRELSRSVAVALFEGEGFAQRVMATRNLKVSAWKNDRARAEDKVYEAFASAAQTRPGQESHWPLRSTRVVGTAGTKNSTDPGQ